MKSYEEKLREFGVEDINQLNNPIQKEYMEAMYPEHTLYGKDIAETMNGIVQEERQQKMKEERRLNERKDAERREREEIGKAMKTARDVAVNFRRELRELVQKHRNQLYANSRLGSEINDRIMGAILTNYCCEKSYSMDAANKIINDVYEKYEFKHMFGDKYGI
jgi:hypothetical protein